MAAVGAATQRDFLGHFRAQAIARRISSLIQPGEKVLDIGAGTCRVACLVQERAGVSVTAVDTVDHNETSLPLRLYDGDILPYEDGAFDVSVIGFVLHHAANYGLVLKEAKRVTRKRIIVLEDTPRNAIEHFIWDKGDYHFNHGKHADIDVAHTVKSFQEWTDYFRGEGLGVLYRKQFRSPFLTGGTYTHSVFVLDTNRD
jgi:SAM-dependent methyltransferase